MRIRFEEVSIKCKKAWIDASGKRRQRTKKFWQTISPFNRNADGLQKTREEIQREIERESVLWNPAEE